MCLVLFSSVFVLPFPATAQEENAPAPLEVPEKADFSALLQPKTVTASQIINPLTIRLNGDRIIQLGGIEIPDLTPYDAGDLTLRAQEELENLLPNRKIRLYFTKGSDKGRVNRMGYELAQVELPPRVHTGDQAGEHIWLQGYLVLNGLARVRPNERNPEMATQMYALEEKARQAKRGMWDAEEYPQYKILDPLNDTIPLNDFAIVEGIVKSVATVRNTTYLNFGQNWREDFTIAINGKLRREFSKTGQNLLSLQGQRVRVRGWVEDYNGPFIRLEDLSLIELLPEEVKHTNFDG